MSETKLASAHHQAFYELAKLMRETLGVLSVHDAQTGLSCTFGPVAESPRDDMPHLHDGEEEFTPLPKNVTARDVQDTIELQRRMRESGYRPNRPR